MLTTLIAAAVFSLPATVEIHPSDDVWAYPHAQDQAQDEFLRVWGYEGQSVAKSAAESESLGYSFMKFDLSGLPEKALKGAELVLTHPPKPTFTLEQAKASPLEARPAVVGISEKNWTYSDLSKFMPPAGKEAVYGSGAPGAISEDSAFEIRIDLTKGPGGFLKAFEAARSGKAIALSLTSTMSPADSETRSTYKVYSRNSAKGKPVLRLTFED
jgi:hypothetical protein